MLGQRPTIASETEWTERLERDPSVDNLIWRDHPNTHIIETTTDRLIPVEYLKEDESYLSRNLGGWSPVYFALIEAADDEWNEDPLLSEAEVLTSYGKEIEYFGADSQLVQSRLQKEFETENIKEIAQAILRLHAWRQSHHFARSYIDMMNFADLLYAELKEGGEISAGNRKTPAVPHALLVDELLAQFARTELARRSSVAGGHCQAAKQIQNWQRSHQKNNGLQLILKGEYVMGRQRRSTILIAGELGIVAKQPAAEPFHEAQIGAKTYNGSPENWPVLTGSGAIVTPAGRMRLTIEQGLIIRLNHIFGHNIRCMSSIGFIIEPFISGPTLQEYLLEDPSRLSQELYEYVLLHQLICEELGVENGDWHSANFIVYESEKNPFAEGVPKMIHIDWGAARPLEETELTEFLKRERLNQVRNIGFSFHDEKLASDIEMLHSDIAEDSRRLNKLREMAEKIVKEN